MPRDRDPDASFVFLLQSKASNPPIPLLLAGFQAVLHVAPVYCFFVCLWLFPRSLSVHSSSSLILKATCGPRAETKGGAQFCRFEGCRIHVSRVQVYSEYL